MQHSLHSDHAAAAIARDSAAVFGWNGETLQEYWWCTERALDWGAAGDPDLVVDDGGDATLLIHEGVKAEEEYEKIGKLSDPSSTDNAEFQLVLGMIRDSLKVDPTKYRKLGEENSWGLRGDLPPVLRGFTRCRLMISCCSLLLMSMTL